MSAFDPKATSADTINFPRRGKHEAAGVSLDTWLGSAAHDNAHNHNWTGHDRRSIHSANLLSD